jgi:DsbC/DsbD-like thiol-disulfide interchange protein
MKTFHLIPMILVAEAAALVAARESAPVQSAYVTARLVTETDGILPGRPITVGLRLDMEKGWHTYTNPPGDAGMPTKITWTLPEGFKASEIQWPKAKDFNLGPLKTRGYDGTVVLWVTITPPGALQLGQTVRIAAKAEWPAKSPAFPAAQTSRWTARTSRAQLLLAQAAQTLFRAQTRWGFGT